MMGLAMGIWAYDEDEDIEDEKKNLSCLTDKMLSENRSDPFEFVDEGTTGMVRINVLHMCCFYLKTEIFAESKLLRI